MIGTLIQRDAAIHEAGHVIIGKLNGIVPKQVYVFEEDGTWRGEFEVEPSQPSGVGFKPALQVSIAGCLSQARAVAEREHRSQLQFDTSSETSLKSLDSLFQEDRKQGWKPSPCPIRMLNDDQSITFPFNAEWFSISDWGAYQRAMDKRFHAFFSGSREQFNTLKEISETMTHLNDPVVWKRINDLADSLVKKPLIDGKHLMSPWFVCRFQDSWRRPRRLIGDSNVGYWQAFRRC